MNTSQPLVEANLRRAAARRQRLRMLQHSATLGAIVCAVFLLLGLAMSCGWMQYHQTAGVVTALVIVAAVMAWLAILIAVAATPAKRPWLAAALERVHPRLLDRLNTLVLLEKARRTWPLGQYLARVERQADDLLWTSPPE